MIIQDILFQRLAEQGRDNDDFALYVLAACEGREALAAYVAGTTTPARPAGLPGDSAQAEVPPTYVSSIQARSFRGIGDDSTVETSDAERADPGNPYNTYVHPGLPPGPIGNPGDVAIDAALNPADGPWLYFVTVNLETGETVFSATLEEHDAAVQRFLQYLEENG